MQAFSYYVRQYNLVKASLSTGSVLQQSIRCSTRPDLAHFLDHQQAARLPVRSSFNPLGSLLFLNESIDYPLVRDNTDSQKKYATHLAFLALATREVRFPAASASSFTFGNPQSGGPP